MRIALPAAVLATLLACAPSPMALEIPFVAKVGSAGFSCSQSFTGLGTTSTSYTPKDFRFYVHAVQLLTEDGAAVDVTLDDDGVWQSQGVALLDFEDATGACANGTGEIRTSVKGTAPGGHYHALRFKLGIPFALNHQDATAAQPPFNTTALFWSWQSGYKFLRADGATTGLPGGHNVHLGSTACHASASDPNAVESCDNANRPEITLHDFDLETQHVVADLGALLAGSNLDVNSPSTSPGCMSSASDADCAPIFARLGLGFGATAGDPAAQAFFSAE